MDLSHSIAAANHGATHGPGIGMSSLSGNNHGAMGSVSGTAHVPGTNVDVTGGGTAMGGGGHVAGGGMGAATYHPGGDPNVGITGGGFTNSFGNSGVFGSINIGF